MVYRHTLLAQRKGQAQPLAAALATATTVLCCLMLMLLTGAVAVAYTVLFANSLFFLQAIQMLDKLSKLPVVRNAQLQFPLEQLAQGINCFEVRRIC